MDTFLPPIEKPKSPMLKLIYFFSKKQFGKILTPIKVFNSRLPFAFSSFASKISQLDKKLLLCEETAYLIRMQVSHINICSFCMDISRWASIQKSMNMEKFNALDHYKDSSLFTEAEKSALDYAKELTLEKKVKPETFAQMAKHYSEREICEIVYLVATEHFYNLTNIGLNIHSDMLCDIRKTSLNS